MANQNLCDIVQDALDWCEGAPQFAGVQRRGYYIAASAIAKWPEREKTDAGRDLASYADKSSFVLKADKKWLPFDMLPAKSQSTSEAQGEVPSGSQLNKLTAVLPGIDEKTSNAAAYINNCPCVFLVQDMDDNWRVFGCKRWAGEIKNTVAQDMGQGSAGTASTTLTVEAPDTTPMPFYKGEIDSTDDPVTEP